MYESKMKRKTQEQLRFEKYMKTMITILFIIITILIVKEITVQLKGVNVTQLDRPEVCNPMDPKRKIEYTEEVITPEKFCKALNENEGKEVYYVKNDQIFLKEEYNTQTKEEINEPQIVLVQKEEVSHVSYTDVQLLAEVMWAEAEEYINLPESEAEEVFKLVGSVVINRKNDSNYYKDVNTISEVIYQKGQYATRTKERIGKQEIPSIVYVWAEEILEQGAIGPANMFYEDNVGHGDYTYKQIGKLYFSCKN